MNINTKFNIFEFSLKTDFHVKQTVLSFWNKFAQKQYFQS